MKACVLSILLYSISLRHASAWYLPGSAPKEYEAGALVAVKVGKLTSSKTQLPYSFYHLPFCQQEKLEEEVENLGEILMGDVIQSTPFVIRMLEDQFCSTLCIKNLTQLDINTFATAIDDEYFASFLADNLPGAISIGDQRTNNKGVSEGESSQGPPAYSVGIPVGIVNSAGEHALVNHWNFKVKVHKGQNGSSYRVVGFEISPQSINHQIQSSNGVSLNCDASENLILEKLSQNEQKLARVAFSYSVEFTPSPEMWATRWDVYLQNAKGSAEIHWFSIINALMIVLLLSGIIAMILLRTLLKDIARYNQLDDIEDAQEEFGWKLVHGDVFRRPGHSKLLATCAGTGIQLLGMCIVALVFSLLGFLSPIYRGSLLQAVLVLFTFMGWPAGYVSARFNKLFEGNDITRNFTVTCMTALQFPAVCFGIFFILNLVLWKNGSSGAVPFSTMFNLLALWFGISTPLVFWGSYFGYKKQSISVPVRTNQIPRQIPPSHWLLHPVISHAFTGVLPFCAVFTELLFVLGSVWEHRYYYLFGFVTLVFIILLILCVEISIALTYFLLCSENYIWWWRAYWSSAASAVYVFFYSIFFFKTQLRITKAASITLYFGYTFLMSYAFFLLTGAVGFISAFFFVRAIYGAVKVD